MSPKAFILNEDENLWSGFLYDKDACSAVVKQFFKAGVQTKYPQDPQTVAEARDECRTIVTSNGVDFMRFMREAQKKDNFKTCEDCWGVVIIPNRDFEREFALNKADISHGILLGKELVPWKTIGFANLCVTVEKSGQVRVVLYWTNNFTGTIGRANRKGTGVNQNFITGASNLIAVTLHGDHIYWTNVGPGGLGNAPIGRARIDGNDVDQNFILAGGPAGIAVAGKYIYWSNDGESTALGGGSSIGRANLDGTGVDQSFITGAHYPNGVAADSKHVYWANSGAGAIGRAKLDGSDVNQNFISAPVGPVGLAVNDRHIYWTNLSNETIGRAKLDGSDVHQNFITGTQESYAVAVDREHIYWTNLWTNLGGTIGRAKLDGNDVNQSFITGASGPSGLAVEDD
jgi:virginiamycin B lyase